MNKKPEVTALTKQNIVDAFWNIYSIKKIERITVKEITTKAGYNRGTFYEYFKDVYDVLEQIESSLLPEASEFPPVEMPDDLRSDPLDSFIKTYSENYKYYIVLLGENGDPSFLRKIKDSVKPKIKHMLISQGSTFDFELDYTIEYTLSAMIGVLNYWFTNEDRPPSKELLKLMYELMSQGVTSKLPKM